MTLKLVLRAGVVAAALPAGAALAAAGPLVIGQTADFSGPQASVAPGLSAPRVV